MEGKNMFDPTFVKHPSPYDLNNIPTPPPPPSPKPKQPPLWRGVAIVLVLTLIVILVGIIVFLALRNAISPTTAPLAIALLPWLTRPGSQRNRRTDYQTSVGVAKLYRN